MPKVKLGRDSYAECVKATAKIIDHAKVEKDMKFQREVAQAIGMSANTFRTKMRTGTWTHKELFTIANIFKISDDDLLRMMGRKANEKENQRRTQSA